MGGRDLGRDCNRAVCFSGVLRNGRVRVSVVRRQLAVCLLHLSTKEMDGRVENGRRALARGTGEESQVETASGREVITRGRGMLRLCLISRPSVWAARLR